MVGFFFSSFLFVSSLGMIGAPKTCRVFLWVYAMLGLQPSRSVSANYTVMGTDRAGMHANNGVVCSGVSPLYPDWGIVGTSPKRLPCQPGTVCRTSVACVVGGGAAVPPCTASRLLLRVLKLG